MKTKTKRKKKPTADDPATFSPRMRKGIRASAQAAKTMVGEMNAIVLVSGWTLLAKYCVQQGRGTEAMAEMAGKLYGASKDISDSAKAKIAELRVWAAMAAIQAGVELARLEAEEKAKGVAK